MISEEFKEYFKFPLIHRDDFLYVLTHDGEPALTWLIDPEEIDKEEQAEIINKMNGYSAKKFEKKWNIHDEVFIYYGDKKIFLVRGCYLLMNNKKYGFPHDKAKKLQMNFVNYIVNKLNK